MASDGEHSAAEAGGGPAACGGAGEGPAGHEPVLMREVLGALDVRAGQTVVDCTLGRAGHAGEIARRLGGGGLLIGTDVDPRNLEFARARLAAETCRVRMFHAKFAEMEDVLAAAQVPLADAIFADLGLRTNQMIDPTFELSYCAGIL